VKGNWVRCDSTFADVADPCVAQEGDANYACDADGGVEIVCRANETVDAGAGRDAEGPRHAGQFLRSNTCRGAKGCRVVDDTVHCDQSMGREGELCRPVDNFTCSDDGKTLLKCSADMRWTKNRDCKRMGSRIQGWEENCY
jgi:hypothetical protein